MPAGATFLVGGLCPVTGGNPTKMTETGFARACSAALAASREAEGKGIMELRYRRCLVCRGNLLPDELTIIELPVTGGEEQMGSKYEGTCACCGRERKQLQKQYGEVVCPSCTVMRTLVRNMPEVVVEQLRKLATGVLTDDRVISANRKTAAELAEVLEPANDEGLVECARRRMADLEAALNNNMDLVMENRALKENGGSAESSLLAKLREVLKAGDGDIVRAAELLIEKMNNTWEAAKTIRDERDQLADQVKWLQTKLAARGEPPLQAVLEARECSCSCGRDEVLFDLLLDALGDQVINLSASRIKALREVRHG
jgi:hypothetical protein